MKRSLLLVFLFFINLLQAQNMSVESFRLVENDQDARINEPRIDQNNQKAALIKIQTIESGFAFDVGQLGVVATDQDRVGEVWVYIPQGAIRISIKHRLLGGVNYEFPIAIKSAMVYEMKLTSSNVYTVVEEDTGGQYFVLNCNPANATVVIDGGAPMSPKENGSISRFLSYGEHTYRITAPNYESVEGVVTIASEKVTRSESLSPRFGYISINTTPASSVSVNGVAYGSTPYRSARLPFGEYEVVMSAPNHESITRRVTINQPEQSVVVNESMAYTLSNVKINTKLRGTSIYINEEYMGEDQWSGDLPSGEHIVRCAKESHRDIRRKIKVVRDEALNVSIEALSPIYGTLNVDSQMDGVTVSIDGVKMGEAPDIFRDVLVGRRVVEYSREGYVTKREEVVIEEGRITHSSIAGLDVEEQFGWISVKTTLGADIVITNAKTGEECYRSTGGYTWAKTPRLDYGEYRVQISMAGHKSETQRVRLDQPKQEEGVIKELRLTFEAKQSNFSEPKIIVVGQYGISDEETYGTLLGYGFKSKTNTSGGMYAKFMTNPKTSTYGSITNVTVGFFVDYSRWMIYMGVGLGVMSKNINVGGAYDIGLMYRINRILVSVGYNSISGDCIRNPYRAGNIGIGFCF